MRGWGAALLAMLAACDQQQPSPGPPPIAFDGALAQAVSARVAHGKRIADVLGCTGCHGANLQGKRFYELYASNLTRDLRDYSDADIERVLREGVAKNGRELWGMPSEIFQHLSKPDTAALIVYIRTLRPAGGSTQPRLPWEPETAKMIAGGKLKPATEFVREAQSQGPADLGPEHALGRYISRVTCAECHGPELRGNPGDTPDLIVAGGYTRDQFEMLMTTGVPVGGRKLRLMDEVSRDRFAPMTRHERDALYAYLRARAEAPESPSPRS
jgi:mono/diheme cytochrome c family protein